MASIGRSLGATWAAPLTAVGLACVALLSALGWCSWDSKRGAALVWRLQESHAPRGFTKWASTGHTVGNVVLLGASLDTHAGRMALEHQQAHVGQQMRLGLLWPVAYACCWAVTRLACRHAHPKWDHPFEVDARRAAHQVIDVVGLVEKTRRALPSANNA